MSARIERRSESQKKKDVFDLKYYPHYPTHPPLRVEDVVVVASHLLWASAVVASAPNPLSLGLHPLGF